MAQVTVKINGYAYAVGCEDGQEQHLLAMAQQVENRIASIKTIGGQSGEARLLALASLLMADELHDLHVELGRARGASASSPTDAHPTSDPRPDPRIEALAARAEEIAAGLEDT